MPRKPKNHRPELARLIRIKAEMVLRVLEELESGQPQEYPTLHLLGLSTNGADLSRMCDCYIENKEY